MPFFQDENIFGLSVVMTTTSNPPAIQQNAYPTINGVETVNLGSRGRVTEVHGYLVGPTVADVAAACQYWRTLQENAIVGTLVTTDGSAYPYAYVSKFQETERIMISPNGALRPYTATFTHLV